MPKDSKITQEFFLVTVVNGCSDKRYSCIGNFFEN